MRNAIIIVILATVAAAITAQTPVERSTQSSVLSPQSSGCETCHTNIEPMHASNAVNLSCTDCHGGNPVATTKDAAHVKPLHPEKWRSSANPERSYTALLQESPEFVKFVNPGDLRVAPETCGGCHAKQVAAVPRSTMATTAVFWAAVGYANGILSQKTVLLG
jgi:Zn finger protein HypA/HybF involved in hydrogenase expression